MKRKEFLSSACKVGLCSCAGLSFLSGNVLFAQSESEGEKELKSKIGFMQRRFAKFLELLDNSVDNKTKEGIIQSLGRECAKESKEFYIKHKNNPEALLKEMEKFWAESSEYDKENNTIKIIGRPIEKCGCNLVDNSITPKDFCNCSKGWSMEAFSEILGKPVDVEILESVLMGGTRCSFAIKIS